ncbi:uncharacterized protein MELLADRAFT_102200 [Melampsora larici-populina 98AG31]|uniref:Secreted protein n=1 Tax=Melampsora larici-populina (strain 98AG31 / pathotype 3-4-7) TaxID=747676 RepID=F4R7I4_MELLP|nr:uncharacterized protein MELLADRAFT_102200 [Melampsora larici-populina 98AG31]EGG11323.1 hypothetical protein MELLADRAFT_102200 [Melampsora larici-populina 98AG31]
MQTIFSIALVIFLVSQTCFSAAIYPRNATSQSNQQITCDTPVDPARVEDIVSIINNYDSSHDGNCTFKAGSGLKGCDFLCEDGSFIVICNQNPGPVIGNCSTLGEIVQKTIDQCQGDNSTIVQGQFYDTELNLTISIGGGLQNCSTHNGSLTP